MYWGELGLIQVVSCNPKDQFSKKKARILLVTPDAAKQEFNVEKELKQREFMEWCEKKYKKLYEVTIDMNSKAKVLHTEIKNKGVITSLNIKFLA